MNTEAEILKSLPENFYKGDLEEERPLFLMIQKPRNVGLEIPTSFSACGKGPQSEANSERRDAEKRREREKTLT